MRLIGGNKRYQDEGEHLQAPSKMSLDDLYEEAERLGKVEIGSWSRGRAEIRIDGCMGDYISVKEDGPNLKENLARCIARARAIKEFYRGLS